MSVGTYLREAREASGYSVEQISEKTRLRPKLIKDLELDNFESCGGSTYARGHIRTIGTLVNADMDRLISEFELTTGQVDRPMIDLLTESSATPSNPQRNFPHVSYKFLATSAAVVVGLMILVPTTNSMFKSTIKPTHKSTFVNPSTKVAVPANQAGSTVSRKQQSSVATGSTDGNLIFSADSGTTWIAVTDAAGKNLFTGKISLGQTQTFDATQLLYVTLGNSGAVSVTLNGKNLGTPGAAGEVKYLQYGPGSQEASPSVAG